MPEGVTEEELSWTHYISIKNLYRVSFPPLYSMFKPSPSLTFPLKSRVIFPTGLTNGFWYV